MSDVTSKFAKLIFMNECDCNESVIYEFSDPDGVRSGKSGWSFGKVQWDTRNNGTALKCLMECGFTMDEIHGIVDQTIDVRPFAERLAAHKDVIERYDEAQLSTCIKSAERFASGYKLAIKDSTALLALADYVNQYGAMGNGSAAYYRSLGRAIEAHDVLEFKLNKTKYGKEHPKDCKRRYANLIKIVGGTV